MQIPHLFFAYTVDNERNPGEPETRSFTRAPYAIPITLRGYIVKNALPTGFISGSIDGSTLP